MPIAPGLLVRTLMRPGGRRTTVVIRRSRSAGVGAKPPSTDAEPNPPTAYKKPHRIGSVPIAEAAGRDGFSHPVARALWALGCRARPTGCGDVLLDGRRAALVRVVAEANRCLAAAGRPVIAYPGIGSEGDR